MSALGLDVGTSSCKGLVLTQGGKIIAEHALNYAQRVQVANDTAQIPAEIFRDGVFEVIATLAEKVDQVDPVRALAFSTHGETLIPVDAGGRALGQAMRSGIRAVGGGDWGSGVLPDHWYAHAFSISDA